MHKMQCESVETIVIQGIELVQFNWVSKTGRVKAISRGISLTQFEIGQVYLGHLVYDGMGRRCFNVKAKSSGF